MTTVTKVGYKPFVGGRAAREMSFVYIEADTSDDAIAIARSMIGFNAVILEVSGVSPEDLTPTARDPKTGNIVALPAPRVYRAGESFEGTAAAPVPGAANLDPESGALVAPVGRIPDGDAGDEVETARPEGHDAGEAAAILAALSGDDAGTPGEAAQLEPGIKPRGPKKTRAQREAELAQRKAEREEAERIAAEAENLSAEDRKLREGE